MGLAGLWVLFAVVLGLLVWELGRTAVSVRGKSAPLPLETAITADQQSAQTLALADSRVQALTSGQRSEVFGVRQVGQQFTEASAACATAVCYQVEIYSFDENATVTAVVDTDAQQVRDVLHQPNMQPGINQRLANRALQLAFSNPGVIEALGFQPNEADMAPVAAGLPGSSCDQGHLCAGPTFRLGNRILWAIVDLTTETVAALRWTTVSDDGSFVPYRPEGGFCPAPGSASRDGWALSYETTGTDGLRVYNVTYQGRAVLTSASLPEWHVDYNGEYFYPGFVDVTGCGGSGGGFAIAPFGETAVNDLLDGSTVIGFEVVQDFRMSQWGAACNYRYGQRYQFFVDGRFRIVVGAYGRGCGDDPAMQQPVYRPVVRIDVAVNGDDGDSFAFWDGQQWVPQSTETYRTPYDSPGFGPHQLTANNEAWLVVDGSGLGYTIEPGLGQFSDGGRGDAPFVYITQHMSAEGDTDFPIFGSSYCCNDDYNQGPNNFVNSEPISGGNLVIWYVPQATTDRVQPAEDGDGLYCWTVNGEPTPETYPCFTGPMFHPFELTEKSYLPLMERP
ncbi:MAG: hypothetical protein H6654_17085 [Ardenticatenaceae bacterium]|nr:hypothetical protein [Anaerolineales bacterium]MCB8938413.1 hypothetical protein [Ardenticatenaceae bacterium]MCB8975277.1 hypothetical protein [Ardenticatenaceae bacterium]